MGGTMTRNGGWWWSATLQLWWWALWVLLFFTSHHDKFWPYALTSTSVTTMMTYPTTTLSSIGKSQLAVLDGGEWISVQSILQEERKPASSRRRTKYGYMNVVTGKDDKNRRVVAMQCLDATDNTEKKVYQDTIAVIPSQISEEDAISTFIMSLSCVHCALPKLENVGGGGDSVATGRAVVLGSSDVACFAAEGLSSLGIDVTVVNNKGSANVKKNVGTIQVVKPSVGSSGTGFCAHLGHFDALVDTLGNERSNSLSMDDPLDDDGDFYDIGISFGPSVLQLLKTRHNCHKYISTYTHSQEMVANEGIFGGPGKTDMYSEKVGNLAFLAQSKDSQPLLPPKSIGNTLEKLLGNGVIFAEKQREKIASKKSKAVRGWTLTDFWESTSWPRDSSGTGTVRYGLPVREELGEEDEFMISESPYRQEQARAVVDQDDVDEIGDFGLKEAKKSSSVKNQAIQNNPYVLNVLGVEGMRSEIVENQMDCIMFLSAKFCKTCRTINPMYTRMARMSQENDNSNVSFVKAEASGEMGKALGRYLSVQAVPAFVLFRNGEQFGTPLSVSKLPSKKIDRALELLASGAPWDDSILDDENEKTSS